jgi:hypothetical protein
MNPLGNEWFCANTTTNGNAKIGKDVCEALGRIRRQFCEHCGEPVLQGETVCSAVNCGKKATNP